MLSKTRPENNRISTKVYMKNKRLEEGMQIPSLLEWAKSEVSAGNTTWT